MSILKLSNTDIKLSADLIYPVGSIYMSVNSTNPSTLFGGTWEQIKDKFLLSCGDTYSNGSTGGEAEHTLTIDEMPSHNHTSNGTWILHDAGTWASRASTNQGTYDTPFASSAMTWSSNGGDKPHNNMPPYLAVYVWKRTK